MKTTKLLFKVERREINFIQSIIESYDGMAFVSTVDPSEGILELRISPGCETLILDLLESLRKRNGLDFIRLLEGRSDL